MDKYLYMAIETKARELDAKILLSLQSVREGYVTIIGTKTLLHFLGYFPFPTGIFLYKDSTSAMEKIFKRIQEKGHKIVVHDEEGYVQLNWKDYIDSRITYNTLKYVDEYLCWGQEQCKAIAGVKDSINPELSLSITGHPRIDILRDPIRQYNQVLNEKNNKMILINMKFGNANYKDGSQKWLEKRYRENISKSEAERHEFKEMLDYAMELLEYYNKLIEKMIIKFPEQLIVIRPHPVENIEYWKEKYDKYDNVLITNDYPIGYWLNQADVVLHTGCTTAIEGFLMGVPAIAYKPIFDKRFEIELPNIISFEVEAEEDCLNMIESLLAGDYDKDNYDKKGMDILDNHLASLQGDLSTKAIVKELNKYELKKENYNYITKLKIIFGFFFLKNLIKIKYYLSGAKRAKEDKNIITEKEVINTIQNFKNVSGDTTDYIVTKVAKNIILITAENIDKNI